MTADPAALALLGRRMAALSSCTMPLGSAQKRFVQSTCWRRPETLSERQAAYVAILTWRFRRQIAADLVPAEEPPPLATASPPSPPARPPRRAAKRAIRGAAPGPGPRLPLPARIPAE